MQSSESTKNCASLFLYTSTCGIISSMNCQETHGSIIYDQAKMHIRSACKQLVGSALGNCNAATFAPYIQSSISLPDSNNTHFLSCNIVYIAKPFCFQEQNGHHDLNVYMFIVEMAHATEYICVTETDSGPIIFKKTPHIGYTSCLLPRSQGRKRCM